MSSDEALQITHFVENLERGGLERTVIDLIRAQTDAGHECRVVCLFQEGALAPELASRGIRVEACGKKHGADFGALRRARQLLRQQPDGVLHTHNAAAHYHAALAAAGLPLRRLVNTRHGMGESNPRSRREWLYRRAMGATDYAVAVCEAARERLAQTGVKPRLGLLSIPNGIRLEGFSPTNARAHAALATRLGLPADTRLVGTVGRLQPVKDQAGLIRAFKRVHDAMPQTALVLVGDGALRQHLQEFAAGEGLGEAVHFLGDRSDVATLLQGFDVFVLSSLSEGYSIALLEACAAALPIVATDVGGNREIVQDGATGTLVPPSQPRVLADAMIDLLASPSRAQAMGEAGRRWVSSEASFRTMAARYHQLYAGTTVALTRSE